MSTEKEVNHYTAEFKARAVKLAVESNQLFSKTAEELGG
jgi:transposase-like protein